MMDFLKKNLYETLKDCIFCLCLLFLCYNPYTGFSAKQCELIIFFSFIFYLMIPRLLRYNNQCNLLNIFDIDKVSEQKDAFVATLCHDLKTPTISQIAGLQILLDETFGNLNSEQKSLVSGILDSCKYMKTLVFTILETYRVNAGALNLVYEYFDIKELVLKCQEEVQSLAKESMLNIRIHANNMETSIIYADKIQIKRVIMNLIANALNYADKNSCININLANDKGFFRFYIENSGRPIPDKILKQLFKKYTSFSSKYAKIGIGLGLYLSKRIINAHNGNIKAESLDDMKNVFSFYIPSVRIETNRTYNKRKVTF